ncbi:nucleotide sugar dehydrogenase [Sandaracinus amylolyticus]|uniref:nucleotide sugar dehydrogenase n=1 Tax=Sandaracinus amylolyticus TaxID=927083 RepID=UPI001F01DD57|nr:nucleotide sugar dehydrogenase [Sandaracinus amylolyticus]UJR80425.1 UDP-N-acetyl-D-galactosamine dehydrogenase [Sandaracinus amylolyticus]
MKSNEKIVVVGLGYVGLPVALAFARQFEGVVGFDISQRRIDELVKGIDRTNEVDPAELKRSTIRFTADPAAVTEGTFFVVTVPTPIDENRQPDLTPVVKASESVGKLLKPGAVVVYESTVYPGVTEDVCAPILQRVSGLSRDQFRLGYSPERINPGDKQHTLETTTKVVSGEDAETLERVAKAYEAIIPAGVHRAPSIKVAEAAKVIENTQRDLNIALMNELALIFDRLGIRTRDVLEAAGTKWNFLKFQPGLVGGHCIGVDPYYLTSKAQSVGYHPEVILAGRRINDGMGAYIAQRTIKLLIEQGVPVKGARVGIFGLTFKENVPDLRNSRVPDIIAELRQFGIEPVVHDPRADAEEAMHEYQLTLSPIDRATGLDALILAVAHREYEELRGSALLRHVRNDGVIVDVKSMLGAHDLPAGVRYWAL